MSQNFKILQHLKQGNTITPLEALHLFGSLRLGARIKDLRDMGANIITETISHNGKRFAQYSLVNPFTELP